MKKDIKLTPEMVLLENQIEFEEAWLFKNKSNHPDWGKHVNKKHALECKLEQISTPMGIPYGTDYYRLANVTM